ncbi:MAG: DNA gyrase inhibitor YacG [Deltaproteobacteria bacterium]|nr:DNA gyrase inhibitor YacG [Deltaproteobacteria bacterium]
MAKKTIVLCPACSKKVIWEENPYRPFCSERCRTIDLGDWASEKFKIPGEKVNPDNLPEEEQESSEKEKTSKKK